MFWRPDPELQEIYDYSVTRINSYQGGPYQEAVSALTFLNNDWYNGNAYQSYGFDYTPGAEGEIVWSVGSTQTWKVTGASMGPNGNVGQRVIPEEPMSLIVNFGMSPTFAAINYTGLAPILPATMRIDYIRIYQDGDGEMTCDPEGYPTTAYIASHPEPYANPNVTKWADAGHKFPSSSFVDGCTAENYKRDVKGEEKRSTKRKGKKSKRKRSWLSWR